MARRRVFGPETRLPAGEEREKPRGAGDRGAVPRRADEKPRRRRSAPPAEVRRPARRHPVPFPASSDMDELYGFHAVREALRSPVRQKLRLMATAAAAEKLAADIAASGLVPEIVGADEIARRLPVGAVHQGLLLEARPRAPIDLADLPKDGLVVVLDQITDPHNVGAILRTAAAFGVDALVTTQRHAPSFSGIVAKSASGGLEHVALVRAVNLARALEELGDRGYLRVGLDANGPLVFEETTLSRPLALVLGAEGKGLRRLSRANCDVLARLDMPGKVKSLNVSNACAVALAIARLKLGR